MYVLILFMANFLITGGTQEDRQSYTLHMARQILDCQDINILSCPNIFMVQPETQDEGDEDFADIKLEQIANLIHENQKSNFNDGKALFIITHAHNLTKSAANALLKTLEDTSKNKIFLALAPSRLSVLPTIASRLVNKRVTPQNNNLKDFSFVIDKIKTITKTKPSKRVDQASGWPDDRKELLKELSFILEALHHLLHSSDNCVLDGKIIGLLGRAIIEAQRLLQRNLSSKLVIEEMLFSHWPYCP